jgi:hypothetical protein
LIFARYVLCRADWSTTYHGKCPDDDSEGFEHRYPEDMTKITSDISDILNCSCDDEAGG